MGLKTFRASTAKEALSQISRELGPDAVIVSHRRTKDSEGRHWVEATAALPEERTSDATAFPGALRYVFDRKKGLWIGGLTVLLALLVAAAIFFWPRNGSPPHVEEKRLVVLPFENLGLPEDTYFADGITDEITTRLSKIEGLAVIARTSANLYKNSTKTLREIGDELGVDYVVEGAIRWQKSSDDPDRVRLSPQLIRVSDGTHVWAHIYEEDITDIFKVQSEVAEHVAEALDITLNKSERLSLEAMPTGNIEAYNYYLRGNDYSKRGHERWNIRSAIQLYEKAVELDPFFALAYARLSYSHSRIYGLHHDRTKERLNNAKRAAHTAFEIIPGNSKESF